MFFLQIRYQAKEPVTKNTIYDIRNSIHVKTVI